MKRNVQHDMDDSRDMPEVQPLRDILQYCQENVLPQFRDADDAALKYQQEHRRRAESVAWLGAAAVILAVFQIFAGTIGLDGDTPALRGWPDWSVAPAQALWRLTGHLVPALPMLEFLVVAAMVGLVLYGIRSYTKEEWLLERYKAERLRLLKFAFLLDPVLWGHDPKGVARSKDRLSTQVDAVVNSTQSTLECWLSEGTIPSVWEAPPEGQMNEAALEQLLDYWRKKRIGFQMDYLAEAMHRYTRLDRKTRLAAPVLFFGSVAAVLAHLAVEAAHGNKLSQFFIFLAASLPALGSTFRTVRSAYESARNASRFEANLHILNRLSDRLQDESSPGAVFRELGFCEQVLEADHREWMRLMVEAEWFG